MILRLILILTLQASTSLYVIGQKQTNNWYFGFNAGISFNSGAPVPLSNGIIDTWEGCATISDKNGNLLFYTDGIIIRNANHIIMPNGSGLTGNTSSSQSGIIVPQPGNDSLYYVFTIGTPGNGLHYSIVNMNRQGGLGDVVQKNILLLSDAYEKVNAVRHCNNRDVWVLTRRFNTDAYYAYLVTSSGISTSPVVSNTGNIITGSGLNSVGIMKCSPDGKKLAAAHVRSYDYIELLDFNNQTGQISNPVKLTVRPSFAFPEDTGVYGIEFSSDNRFLYATSYYDVRDRTFIHQFDISLGSEAAIQASRVKIDSQAVRQYGAMQLGPDGKIYVTENGMNSLSVINAPNSSGALCDFQRRSLFLGAATEHYSVIGLPTFIQSYLIDSTLNNFTTNGNCTSTSVDFQWNNSSGIDSVKWNFGDPVTGSSNFSTVTNPVHVFSGAGAFNVEVIVYKNPCNIRDTIRRTIWVGQINTFLGNDTALCEGDTLHIRANAPSSAASYLWSNGSTGAQLDVSQSGNFWVRVSIGNCQYSDTISVTINQLPSTFTLGVDSSICAGQTVTFTPDFIESGNTYLWNNGSVNAFLTTNAPGLYWLRVTNANQCYRSDSVILQVKPLPVFSLGPDKTACQGEIISLVVNNSNSRFLWNTGNTSNQQNINGGGLYWLEVQTAGCSARDSIMVNFNPSPIVDLGRDTIICEGQQLLLNAGNPGANYLWQDGSSSSQLFARNEGTYSVRVSENGCSKSDSIYVDLQKKPFFSLGNDQVYCEGMAIELKPIVQSESSVNYLWQDGSVSQVYLVKGTGIYRLSASNSCGVLSDTIAFTKGYCNLKVPNAFTPNGDGKNDIFRAMYSENATAFSMKIFNRWGQLVFQTEDKSKGWDGTIGGSKATSGTYVWLIEYRTIDGAKGIEKGTVTLIR